LLGGYDARSVNPGILESNHRSKSSAWPWSIQTDAILKPQLSAPTFWLKALKSLTWTVTVMPVHLIKQV